MTARKLEIRGNLETVYADVYTPEAVAALAALADLSLYQSQRSLTSADMLRIGDFNQDGKLTNADLQGLVNFLASGGNGSISVVPEPPALALMALALTSMALLRMRMLR